MFAFKEHSRGILYERWYYEVDEKPVVGTVVYI